MRQLTDVCWKALFLSVFREVVFDVFVNADALFERAAQRIQVRSGRYEEDRVLAVDAPTRQVAFRMLPVVRDARDVEYIVEPGVLGTAAILDEVFSLFEERFGVVCQADEELLFLLDDSQQLFRMIGRRLRPNAVRKSENE